MGLGLFSPSLLPPPSLSSLPLYITDDVHDGCQANTTDKRRDQSSDECADECSELTVAVVVTAVLGPLLGALIGALLTILAHKFCCKNGEHILNGAPTLVHNLLHLGRILHILCLMTKIARALASFPGLPHVE